MASKATEIFAHPQIGSMPPALAINEVSTNIPKPESIPMPSDTTQKLISDFILYLEARDQREALLWQERNKEIQLAMESLAAPMRSFLVRQESNWLTFSNTQKRTNFHLEELVSAVKESNLSYWEKLKRWFRG